MLARPHIVLQAELVLDDEITAIVTGVDGHVWNVLLIRSLNRRSALRTFV
jgi:hypothetical protein